MTDSRLVRRMFVALAVWSMIAGAARAADEKAKDVVATWKLKYDPGNGDHEATLTVIRAKPGLKGKFVDGDRKFDVTKIEYKDSKLTFTTRTERDGDKATATFEGKIKGDAIEGEASWEYQGMSGSFPFTGKREDVYRSASEEKVTVTAAKLKLMSRKSEERWFVPVGEYLTKAKDFDYVEEELSATGVDHLGAAYTTQVFVRRPRDPAKFSGVVIVEPLHAASVAPIYMYCSPYILRSGHGWACIASQKTALDQHVKPANTDRYNTLHIESGLGAGVKIAPPTSRDASALVEYMRKIRQINIASNTILGQAGTALRSASGPFGKVNKMILAGHSQTGWVASDYVISAHAKARREDGAPVYDGFFPTGAPRDAFGPRDVPLIQLVSDGDVFDTHSLLLQPENPGRHYRRPDSDDPNDRYRLYELAAVGHLGTRYPPHSDASFSGPRQGGLISAKDKMNSLPHHELFNMALDHLIKWVTKNVVPPRAPRIELAKGGLFFAKDQYGNSRGGVRCAQLDLPKATYHPVPLNAKRRPTFATVGTQVDFDVEKLKCLYGTPANYARLFNARLDELVYQGWLLSEDAKKLRADVNATSW